LHENIGEREQMRSLADFLQVALIPWSRAIPRSCEKESGGAESSKWGLSNIRYSSQDRTKHGRGDRGKSRLGRLPIPKYRTPIPTNTCSQTSYLVYV